MSSPEASARNSRAPCRGSGSAGARTGSEARRKRIRPRAGRLDQSPENAGAPPVTDRALGRRRSCGSSSTRSQRSARIGRLVGRGRERPLHPGHVVPVPVLVPDASKDPHRLEAHRAVQAEGNTPVLRLGGVGDQGIPCRCANRLAKAVGKSAHPTTSP